MLQQFVNKLTGNKENAHECTFGKSFSIFYKEMEFIAYRNCIVRLPKWISVINYKLLNMKQWIGMIEVF